MTQAKHETWIQRYWPALLIGGAWLWLFWPMMTGQQVVGFRDSAYLYYPYFKWIDAQWAAGQIPLWNPYCNWGYPVVADGTSSVFYPGKLIFFCRFLSYPARYGLYLAIHIPIAAAGTFWFARTLKANRAGATLAAFSFAFGGSVLFQVTNVIYLVSAAWLPFAVCCVWKMTKTGQPKWAVAAGVCCALMILGGDPQMVYHVGLIAVATIVGEFLRRRRRRLRTRSEIKSSPYRWLFKPSGSLVLMVGVTTILAAVQILPTYVWAKHSERTNPIAPVNLYKASEMLIELTGKSYSGDALDVMFALVEPPEGIVDHAYQFSQPPWSIAELFWPNISGKPFPRHQRWASSLPGADRVWVPSVFMGTLVALLAMFGFRLWGRRRKQVWLSWLLIFFALASFGWYGAVWFFNEIMAATNQSELGPQVGGLYWLMNMVLPKYFAFRYPAKLFVIASLAIALLAGTSLRTFRVTQLHVWIAAFCLITINGIVGFRFVFENRLHDCLGDPMFGPFDVIGATSGIYASAFQALLVVSVFGWFVWNRGRALGHARRLVYVLVVLTVVDVIVANSWLVSTVDSSIFESKTNVHTQLVELQTEADAEPIRVFRERYAELEPKEWKTKRSSNRLAEVVNWQRESLYPKHHLGENVILFGSFSSIWPMSYQRELDEFEGRFPNLFHNLGIDAVVQSPTEQTNTLRSLRLGGEQESPSRFDRWTKMPRLFMQSSSASSYLVTAFEPNRVVVEVKTDTPRWLDCGRIADKGWKATIRDLSIGNRKPAQINVFPELELSELNIEQPGEYEIEFVYSPIEFWIGAWVSSIGWLSVCLFGVVLLRKRFPGGSN